MTHAQSTFTKGRLFIKNACTEYHENPTNTLDAATTSQTDRHTLPHICGAIFFINVVKCPRTSGDHIHGSRIFQRKTIKFQFRFRPPFCAPLLFMKQAPKHYVFTIISTHSNQVLITPYFTHRSLQHTLPAFKRCFFFWS